MSKCIECQTRPAHHWKSNFCMECTEKLFTSEGLGSGNKTSTKAELQEKENK